MSHKSNPNEIRTNQKFQFTIDHHLTRSCHQRRILCDGIQFELMSHGESFCYDLKQLLILLRRIAQQELPFEIIFGGTRLAGANGPTSETFCFTMWNAFSLPSEKFEDILINDIFTKREFVLPIYYSTVDFLSSKDVEFGEFEQDWRKDVEAFVANPPSNFSVNQDFVFNMPTGHIKVQSRHIKWVEYYPVTKVLEVEFRNGSTYEYFDIPKEVVQALLTSASAGEYFAHNIKETFKFAKVD